MHANGERSLLLTNTASMWGGAFKCKEKTLQYVRKIYLTNDLERNNTKANEHWLYEENPSTPLILPLFFVVAFKKT